MTRDEVIATLRAQEPALKRAGISDADIDLMSRKNPARLLGLDP